MVGVGDTAGAGAARWYRPAMAGLAVGLLAIPLWQVAQSLASPESLEAFGVDYRFYTGVALRWLDGGHYFEPWQLDGPHSMVYSGEVLYPPIALWLLVPFAHMPAVLWWAIPMAGLAWALWRMRPAPWAWPLMAACAAGLPVVYWLGQPTVWLPTLVALGLLRGGWAALVFVKPSLFPFALIGIHRRAWWTTVGVMAVLSLPFGTLWLDWVAAVANSGGGLLYSLHQVPALLLPVVAWAGRRGAAETRKPAPEWAGVRLTLSMGRS